MIRLCIPTDFDDTIPADRLRNPYMSREELQHEINNGVAFAGYEDAGRLVGVMGTQDVDGPEHAQPVTLIRHAYVRTSAQGQGIGAKLLAHLRELTTRPVLIGTWADATWAVRFYQRHGFELVSTTEKEKLLRRYWTVPDRQIATSVVLADATWRLINP